MAKKSNRNTRGRIVSAAWKLFYEQGYEDTTVEEIIELSGTSKGSFYHYFDGKDALLSTLSSLFDEKYEELTGLLTPEMLKHHLVKEMPERDQMIQAVAQYAKVMQTQVLDKKTTMFFSEDGIKSFLETGRVDEYPKECYSPLDFDERIALIRRFLALRDRANLRMIRETKERAEHALNISVNANEGYLLFQTRTERLIYLSIREPSILMAFYDYLESMKPEELCTEEEMLERVEAILHEFVACHSREGSI